MIPNTIHSSVRSGAERRMFNVIKNAERTDNWICLHSLGLARHDTKRLGEIDFVLVTMHGVFVLEVKGGRVRRQSGTWIYTDKFDREHFKIEGPFDQAAGSMFTLERELRSAFPGTRIADVLVGFGVIVPDINFDVIGPDIDRAQVYDINDRQRPFRTYIDRLADFARSRESRRRRGLRDAEIRQVADYLRGDFDLIPGLDMLIEDTEHQLLQLTEEQFVVLDVLENDPRVIIEGAAGCGKTVLALETVRRTARNGDRILVTCYNRLLADRLSEKLADEFAADHVVVVSLHQLFSKLINESSVAQEFEHRRAQLSDRQIFEELMPELALYAALEEVMPRFDVLIVDEAQDVITSDNLEVLSELLNGGMDDGRWWLFLDSNNQASIYGKFDRSIFDKLRINSREQVLTINCRNTKEIAYHTSLMAQSKLTISARIEGPPVEFISYSKKNSPFEKLREILRKLKKKGVHGKRITILLARSPDNQTQIELRKLGISAMREQSGGARSTGSEPTWSVVSGFKGLESDVIILVGIENVVDDWWQAVCYVGMSRARSILYIILTSECEELRKRRWETELERTFNNK